LKNVGLSEAAKRTLGSDLICPEWFKFSVECKNYQDSPNYATIVKKADKTLNGWLAETIFDSINLNLSPLLIFRTTRKGTHVALPYEPFYKNFYNWGTPHMLKYGEFVIVGLEYFEQFHKEINECNTTHYDDVIRPWLLESQYVRDLLNEFAESMSKGKDNKVKAKYEATSALISQLNEQDQ
jgi:hypothetical protein